MAAHHRQDPTPAAGRIGLAIWPPSGLAPAQHLASEGTRAMGLSGFQGLNGLAKPDQREKCCALVLSTHAQASERAATGLPMGTRTGSTGARHKARFRGSHGSHGAGYSKLPTESRARLSKRVYSPKNFSFTAPVGPLRCLAMMTSARPLSLESLL